MNSSIGLIPVLTFVTSIAAGLLGSLVGLGDGVLIVPLLTLVFRLPIEFAIGASSISVIAMSSGVAAAYVRDHITNIRIGMFLEKPPRLVRSVERFWQDCWLAVY